MLCPDQAESHLRAVLYRRDECDAEAVQEHGCEELRLPLMGEEEEEEKMKSINL